MASSGSQQTKLISTQDTNNLVDMSDGDDGVDVDIFLSTSKHKLQQKKRQHNHDSDEEADADSLFGDDNEGDDVPVRASAKKKTRVNNIDSFLDDQAYESGDDDDYGDDNNTSIALIKEGFLPKADQTLPVIDEDDDDSMSEFFVDDKPKLSTTSVEKTKIIQAQSFMQETFQPTSTPGHLLHRFMCFNTVGIIRSHQDDDGNSINIEFHDSSTHHTLHFANTIGHQMAALSESAAILACPVQDDVPSKLTCMYFCFLETDDNQWTLNMQQGEEVCAVAINNTHVVASTTKRYVRIFSLAGMQVDMFSLPGPVVTMSMHEQQLFVIYHAASGIKKSQCLSYLLLHMKKGKWTMVRNDPISISTGSSLVWAGFSIEGSPCTVDSEGEARMLNRRHGSLWTPFGNLKGKNKSDNYWVIGVEEAKKLIRCILCKASTYPTTLPRPIPSTIPFAMPVLDDTTDKGKLEQDILHQRLYSDQCIYNNKHTSQELDNEDDESVQTQLLMKLFALSCKAERDCRALEICMLMPNAQTVGLAMQYASTQRRKNLAKKLTELAQCKQEQEEMEEEEEENDEEYFDEEEEEEDDGGSVLRANLAQQHLLKKEVTRSANLPSKPIKLQLKSRKSIELKHQRALRAEEEYNGEAAAAEVNDSPVDDDGIGANLVEFDDDDDMEIPSTEDSIALSTESTSTAMKPSLLATPQPARQNPFKVKQSEAAGKPSEQGTQYFENLQQNHLNPVQNPAALAKVAGKLQAQGPKKSKSIT